MLDRAVLAELHANLKDMRAAEERPELDGIKPDTAFELGYETAIYDLVRILNPPVLEVGIVEMKIVED
mgnify:CR=1 FL=1